MARLSWSLGVSGLLFCMSVMGSVGKEVWMYVHNVPSMSKIMPCRCIESPSFVLEVFDDDVSRAAKRCRD